MEMLHKSQRLGDQLFWDVRRQKRVAIPDGVELIGRYWFYGCGVECVIVPVSVTQIGEMAFARCERLKRVAF